MVETYENIINRDAGELIKDETDISAYKVLDALKRNFPLIKGMEVVDEDEIFLGDCAEGGEINGMPACDYFTDDMRETVYIMGVHKLLHKFLDKCGWFAEAHDPGTYSAYRN